MPKHRHPPLPSRHQFLRHLARSAGTAAVLVIASLAIGTLGYHDLAGLPWIDALLNAAMILTGMGPVNELHTNAGKLFAAAYALFSGVIFLTMAAVIFAPAYHRFLHRFHLEFYETESAEEAEP